MPKDDRVDEVVAAIVDALGDAVGGGVGVAQVLDCGGGSGRFAVPFAASGASVTVIDISVDALATLRRRADEAGVGDRIVAVQGDIESAELASLGSRHSGSDGERSGNGRSDVGGSGEEPDRGFDAVLAHGIFESVDLAASFGAVAAAVRPGGVLSVLAANPVAGVLARALAGDLAGAERELHALERADGDAHAPTPARITALCADHGLVVEQVRGIGVFRDLVPGRALDAPGGRETLDRLERAGAQRSPFAEIAGRVHVLARRPVG